MYADDIILLSKSAKGLQEKLDILNTYCKDWCLTVNTSKTKIIIFNKAGRLIKQNFWYGNGNIECVSNCKYLGIWFSSSGSYSYAQNELYKKYLKAFFKLKKDLLSLRFSFLHFIENGLNMPQLSLPYNKIGLIVWSNTCMLVLIFGLSDSRSFFNLKNAFRYFLYNSF
jgi:hypothetical protein